MPKALISKLEAINSAILIKLQTANSGLHPRASGSRRADYHPFQPGPEPQKSSLGLGFRDLGPEDSAVFVGFLAIESPERKTCIKLECEKAIPATPRSQTISFRP